MLVLASGNEQITLPNSRGNFQAEPLVQLPLYRLKTLSIPAQGKYPLSYSQLERCIPINLDWGFISNSFCNLLHSNASTLSVASQSSLLLLIQHVAKNLKYFQLISMQLNCRFSVPYTYELLQELENPKTWSSKVDRTYVANVCDYLEKTMPKHF